MGAGEAARSAHIIIVRATVADATTMLALHEEAARWLEARGIQQRLPGDFAMEPLVAQIGRGEAYLARIGGGPVGALTRRWAGPRLWREQPHGAALVHGPAVRTRYA